VKLHVKRSEGRRELCYTPIESRWLPVYRRYIHLYGTFDSSPAIERGRDYYLWWFGYQFHLEIG
jgi:hypothetical protein